MKMPTGARLVSAIVFAIVAFVAAKLAHAALEAEAGYTLQVGMMPQSVAAIGGLCGWIVMGKRVGEGLKFSVSGGLLTSVAILFWSLLVFSVYEMILESTKMKYSGATEATVDVFRIALDYSLSILSLPVVQALLFGGVIGGLAAEWASRRYR